MKDENKGLIPQEKNGVDEKKEPETAVHKLLREKRLVSEGEPNQEELFKEMIKIYEDYRMPSGFYNSKEAREKVLNLYHIQKLKP